MEIINLLPGLPAGARTLSQILVPVALVLVFAGLMMIRGAAREWHRNSWRPYPKPENC
jgi:hypothetical protein